MTCRSGDRLPWHRLVVIALGIIWLPDGLEVTLLEALVGVRKDPRALGLTETQIGVSRTAYRWARWWGCSHSDMPRPYGAAKAVPCDAGGVSVGDRGNGTFVRFGSYATFRALSGCGTGAGMRRSIQP